MILHMILQNLISMTFGDIEIKKNPVTFNQLTHVTATQRSAWKTWFTVEWSGTFTDNKPPAYG